MNVKKALRWFEELSPFQHGAIAVLLPLLVFILLFVLLVSSAVPFSYVAIAAFVSFGLIIPCVTIYVLALYIREEE